MKLQLFIAFRYLFSKKTHNAINIISMICAGGICVATLALVCALSVYNGFQQLISGLYNSFDPDIKISLVEGKTFNPETEELKKMKTLDFISVASDVLEENALIRNKDKQTSVMVKGVSDNYLQLIKPDSVIQNGAFRLKDEDGYYTVIGAALANQIESGIFYLKPLSFYAPKYNAKINIVNPENSFNEEHVYLSGVYATNQLELDSKYAFLSLDFARSLFGYEEIVSAIELKVKDGTDINVAKEQIEEIIGKKYKILDKKEQHEDFYRMMKIEKWITFLILLFILLIAVFNVIGSLTMLIIEKKNNIKTLRNLGANSSFIKQIFLFEGWMVTAFGALIGLVIGLILCLLQQYFGFIKLNNGAESGSFIVDAYPIFVEWTDVFLILFSVLFIGLFLAWYPTRYIYNK